MLKKKLEVSGAQHVQYYELTMLQQQKEKIHQEMMDYKGKMLKLKEENKTWEKQKSRLLSQITALNASRSEEKKVLGKLMRQSFVDNEEPTNESFAKELAISMSQINLRDGEIKELREENHKLRWELVHNTEENNKALGERKQLQNKFNDLKDKITGKFPFQ